MKAARLASEDALGAPKDKPSSDDHFAISTHSWKPLGVALKSRTICLLFARVDLFRINLLSPLLISHRILYLFAF